MMSEIGVNIKQLLDNGMTVGQVASTLHIEAAQVRGIAYTEYGLFSDVCGPKPPRSYRRRTPLELAEEEAYKIKAHMEQVC